MLTSKFARVGAITVAAVALAVVFSLGLPEVAQRIPLLAFALAVVVAAWFGGLWPGIAASILSALACALLVLEPRYSLAVASGMERLALAMFLPASWFIVWLVELQHAARRQIAESEREAHAQREVWRKTLASIGDAVIATDADGRITFLNAIAEQMTGWNEQTARDRPLTEVFRIVNESSRAPVENPVERAVREGRIVGLANHTVLIARDGVERPIEDSAAPIVDKHGHVTGAVLVFRDVTERREFEREQRERHQIALLAADVARALSSGDDLPRMLQRCCEAYVTHLEAAFCRIWLYEPDEDVLILRASAGMYTHLDGDHARIPVGQFKIGQIAAERRAILTNAVVGDDRVHDQDWAGREGMIAFAGHPLVLDDELLGVVGMFARHELSETVLQALEADAANLATGIARSQSVGQVRSALDYATSIVDTIRDPLVVLDGDLRVRSANAPFYEHFRLFPAEAEGRLLYELDDGQWDFPALRQLLEEILPKSAVTADYEVEHEFSTIGGRTMLINARRFVGAGNRTDSILLAIEDVTRTRRLAREKQAAERRFETLIEQVQDYAIFMLDVEGRATSWNIGVANVLGYEEDEFLGIDVPTAIYTDEAKSDGIPQWEFDTAARNGTASDDRWMLRKDGTEFWASGITTGLHDEEGRLIGYNKVMRDLTDRKETDDANRRLAADLSDANRRKNEFLATLAHELRNPLAPIKNALLLMTMVDGELSPRIDDLRMVMDRQVRLMVRLVDDLLDVSRISNGKVTLQREACLVRNLVDQAIEAARPFIVESGHEFEVEIPETPLPVHADPARIVQVIVNLLNNAAKYTPEGGHVRLVVSREGEAARIDVIDDGIGIAPDELDSVFHLFSQVDASSDSGRSGLGIGLTLVRSFVEMHGGTISVESAGPGQGSRFWMTLPLVGRSVRSVLETVPAPAETAPAFRLLIVEDTPAILTTFSRVLQRMGHTVEVAENGEVGLRKVREFGPEIVFSDISMPVMNGHEFARRLRSDPERTDLYLVALTGYGQAADRKAAIEAGFDEHIVKPVELDELQRLFASYAARRAAESRSPRDS